VFHNIIYKLYSTRSYPNLVHFNFPVISNNYMTHMQKCEVVTTLAAFNYGPGMMHCNSFEKNK